MFRPELSAIHLNQFEVWSSLLPLTPFITVGHILAYSLKRHDDHLLTRNADTYLIKYMRKSVFAQCSFWKIILVLEYGLRCHVFCIAFEDSFPTQAFISDKLITRLLLFGVFFCCGVGPVGLMDYGLYGYLWFYESRIFGALDFAHLGDVAES